MKRKTAPETGLPVPSADAWLKEAKSAPGAELNGMYLIHNGVVRLTPKALVRNGDTSAPEVDGLDFSFDCDKVSAAISDAYSMPGINYIRVWLNSGRLSVGDDIMMVLVGGDIRPHVIDALQALVGKIKNECVVEKELSK